MMGLAGTGAASREGTRMGLWGAAQAVAFGSGGVAATFFVDAAREVSATPLVAYTMVFGVEALLFVVAAVLANSNPRDRAYKHRNPAMGAHSALSTPP